MRQLLTIVRPLYVIRLWVVFFFFFAVLKFYLCPSTPYASSYRSISVNPIWSFLCFTGVFFIKFGTFLLLFVQIFLPFSLLSFWERTCIWYAWWVPNLGLFFSYFYSFSFYSSIWMGLINLLSSSLILSPAKIKSAVKPL